MGELEEKMKKIIAILSIFIIVLAGCGEDPTRGYSSDPNEFPTDLQALENGATIEEATAIANSVAEEEIESSEDEENVIEDNSSVAEADEESESTDNTDITESTDDADSTLSATSEDEIVEEKPEVIITLVLNTNSMKAHCPDCSSVDDMKPSNRLDYTGTVEDVIAMGYVACKRCNPF